MLGALAFILSFGSALLAGCATYAPPALPTQNISFDGSSEKAVVVLATRVADKKVPEPHLVFSTYDPKAKAVPEDKPRGTLKRFGIEAKMGVFQAPDRTDWAYHSVVIDPGTYILAAAKFRSGNATAYRLNSVYFTARAGDVLYIGDYEFSLSDQHVVETTLSRDDGHAAEALKEQPNIRKPAKFFQYKESGRFEMPAMQLINQVRIDASAR